MEEEKLCPRSCPDAPLGLSVRGERTCFAVSAPEARICELLLYRTGEESSFARLPMTASTAGIFTLSVKLGKRMVRGAHRYEYRYCADGREWCDPYAPQLSGGERFGEAKGERRAAVLELPMADGYQPHPFSDLILYKLHVRGYTKLAPDVKKKGTFAGLAEKIPYLKELGVTGVLLLPVYEFDETDGHGGRTVIGLPKRGYAGQTADWELSGQRGTPGRNEAADLRKNYWGYQAPAFYFAPKASYADRPHRASEEFAALTAQLHGAGIDVYLEMMFDEDCTLSMMLDCLRHWVRVYGVDGFHVDDRVLPVAFAAGDPYLQRTRFFSAEVSDRLKERYPGRLLEYRDAFCVDMRKYLKGDEGMVPALYHYFKDGREHTAEVHYIADHNGFTLRDLYSYDVRHNEANGEGGRDGTEYNFSWNCGEEGETKKARIEARRLKMMKNAMTVQLLSRGVPLLLAGDEFGRTKKGNNNSYCQDNEISWLDWRRAKRHAELTDYTKRLIRFRADHPVLTAERELREMDFLFCGLPEISLHGVAPWQVDRSGYNRLAGILLCGAYVRHSDRSPEQDMYLLFNMHWEPHTFELPKLSGREWELVLSTAPEGSASVRPKVCSAGEKASADVSEGSASVRSEACGAGEKAAASAGVRELAPRSIAVFCSRPIEQEEKGKKKR